MRVAVVTSIEPFVRGGAELLAEWLVHALEAAGHQVETIALPFPGHADRIPEQLALFRMIDLTDQADLVICLRPPAHLVRHPRKVLWFIHHIRVFYDLWGTPYGPGTDPHLRALRDLVRRVDDEALREATHIFTLSETVSARLTQYNGVASEPLFHPLGVRHRPAPGRLGREIVAIGRVADTKRSDLLVRALAHAPRPVRLRFVGVTGRVGYGGELRELATELEVDDRVAFYDGWVDDREKRRRLANALAGAYVAFDEDSYGYGTLEYAVAGKAILATTDSGGVRELVRDGIEGVIAEPTPESVGAAMGRLHEDRSATARMGRAAARRVGELDISWSRVVERLTAP